MTHSPFDPQAALTSEDVNTRRDAVLLLGRSGDPAAVRMLLSFLGDPHWQVRKAAVDTLVRQGQELWFQEVFEGLRDPENAGLRNAAVEVLRKWGDGAVPRILEHLADPDHDVKLALINLLGDIADRSALPALLGLLEDDDKNILSAAVDALGKLKDRRALEPIVAKLQDRDPWITFHVISALGELGDPGALPVLADLVVETRYRKASLDALGQIGDPDGIPTILETLNRADAPVEKVLEVLVRIFRVQTPEMLESHRRDMVQERVVRLFPNGALPALARVIRDGDAKARTHALAVAGWLQDVNLLAAILSVLDLPSIPEGAEEALVSYGSGAVDRLIEEFQRRPDGVAATLIARVLGRIRDPRAVQVLLPRLGTDTFELGMQILESLGLIADARGLRALLDHARVPDAAVQAECVRGVGRMLAAHPHLDSEVASDAIRMYGAREEHVRRAAIDLLAFLQGDRHTSILQEALRDPSPVVRQHAVTTLAARLQDTAVPLLLPILADENARVRRAVLKSLGPALLRDQTDILLSAMLDTDLWVRVEAVTSLASHADPEIVGTLLRAVAQEPVPVKVAALKGLAPHMVERFADTVLATLYQEDQELRKAALTALSRTQLPDADRLLDEALADAAWPIRAVSLDLVSRRRGLEAVDVLLDAVDRDPELLVRQAALDAMKGLHSGRIVGRLMPYLTHPQLGEAVCSVYLAMGRESLPMLRQEAQEVDFKTKMILLDVMDRMEKEPAP